MPELGDGDSDGDSDNEGPQDMPPLVTSSSDEGSDSEDIPQEEGQDIGHQHGHHARIGMCYFHVKDALNMKTDLLPKGKQDARLMLRDVRILSETGISDFMRRWTIFKGQWEDRGWHEFVAYFEKTWVVELPGWNVDFWAMARHAQIADWRPSFQDSTGWSARAKWQHTS